MSSGDRRRSASVTSPSPIQQDQPERLTLLGRLRDLLKLVAAELLAGLGLQDVPVLGSSFVQSLVGVLIVHQSPAPAVQEVLQQSHDHQTLEERS